MFVYFPSALLHLLEAVEDHVVLINGGKTLTTHWELKSLRGMTGGKEWEYRTFIIYLLIVLPPSLDLLPFPLWTGCIFWFLVSWRTLAWSVRWSCTGATRHVYFFTGDVKLHTWFQHILPDYEDAISSLIAWYLNFPFAHLSVISDWRSLISDRALLLPLYIS